MLSRRADLRLFLTFGGFCLLLFLASVLAALFLNEMHRKITRVLNENVRSTKAAEQLEADIRELVRLLRAPGSTVQEIESINESTRAKLAEAQDLANHEEEELLVDHIRLGLHEYFGNWEKRAALGLSTSELATQLDRNVLPECVRLRKYNMDLIVQSEQD